MFFSSISSGGEDDETFYNFLKPNKPPHFTLGNVGVFFIELDIFIIYLVKYDLLYIMYFRD